MRDREIQIPESVELITGKRYTWQVQAVDHKDLHPCPDDCYSNKYEFTVAAFATNQYYQLLESETGNHVVVGKYLRFIVPAGLKYSNTLQLEILDERNQVVKEINLSLIHI